MLIPNFYTNFYHLAMQADFSVELAHGDAILEIPWSNDDGRCRYYDLKQDPNLLGAIEEARQFPELGEFLASINSSASLLESAKCDAWASTDLHAEEEIFGATHKFGGYIDLIFSDVRVRSALDAHERMARRLTELLRRAPEIPASVEFLIRRCYFSDASAKSELIEALYFTCYIFGFGDSEERARQQWAISLKLVENAVRQVSAAREVD